MEAATTRSNSATPSAPKTSKNADWGFTAGTLPAAASMISHRKSPMARARSALEADGSRATAYSSGRWARWGSSPTTQGFPTRSTAS